VFVEDDEARTALDGRFAFETRNPLVREWERWTPDEAERATIASGAVVRMERTLRFLDADSLSSFLSGAGMTIDSSSGTGTASS